MHDIYFYKDRNGNQPVLEYLRGLASGDNKDSRIKLNKIRDYIQILRMYGKQAGEPYIKHLQGEVYELSPLRDRILFVAWVNDSYVLLHHFMKKTQKTPRKEIEKALREFEDLKNSEEVTNE